MFLNPETNKGCHVEMLYVRMVPALPFSLRSADWTLTGVGCLGRKGWNRLMER